MKVVIPGGTGALGTLLARALSAGDHEVVAVSRRPRPAPWPVVGWEDIDAQIDGCDVVINLAGRSVNCRYNAAHRKEILESRVLSTRAVGEAITKASSPPEAWLQASTATIYADRYDAPNDELTGEIGGNEPGVPETWRFSIGVAKAWERAAAEFPTPRTRKVLMRTAIVMSPERGGAFDLLWRLARFGLGGAAAGGRQYVSWIHGADFVSAVLWLARSALDGAVNIAAPNPLPYREFMGRLREVAGTPVGLPATRWMLDVGAFALRTETELVLKSRRVTPRRLLEAGFSFQFPSWSEACADLVRSKITRA
jgi:uncharacterized protein (TIGR01777 family)